MDYSQAKYNKDFTLAAATPLVVDIDLAGCRDWLLVMCNTGGSNAVTAATYARSPLGGLFEPAVNFPAGISLAAGGTLKLDAPTRAPVTTLRLTLTSTSGTTVTLELLGGS